MALAWTLRVQIEDGRNFDLGIDKNESIGGFFRCIFNECINQSSIVRMPTFLSYDVQPQWNEALEWQFDDKTLKKLKKCGSSIKLQLFVIGQWNPHKLQAFPLNNFNKNKQKYNIQQIGYIVLDLKNAISNGTKIKNFNHPQIESKYLRLRNMKMVKHNGIHPQIKVAFWCGLQQKWSDPNTETEHMDRADIDIQQNIPKPSPAPSIPAPSLPQKKEIVVVNENNINNLHDDGNKNDIIGNRWYCVIHKIDLFVDIVNVRCLIVSMNERYLLDLPFDETNVKNNEFSNDYPNFSWYLQSSMSNDKTTNEWNTIASFSSNINQFISNNHSKKFILKLFGSQNKCIAKVTISVSWEPYSINTAPPTIHKIVSKPVEVASPKPSEYSSFSAEQEEQEEEEEEEAKEEDVDKDEDYTILQDEILNDINMVKEDGDVGDDGNSYKYRIGIDIRSVRDLRDSYNIQCRYKYTLFDNNRLFMSNPPISISKCQEKPINDGFCAYEVVLRSKELTSNLYKYPLIIQCIHKDNYSKDIEIGYSFINLSHLLKVNKSASNLRYIDKYYAIYSIKSDSVNDIHDIKTYQDLTKIKCKLMGNIRVCCSLEEFQLEIEKKEEINPQNQANKANQENEENEVKQQNDKIESNELTANFVQNAKYLQEEIVEELKKWKVEQQEKWQKRWKLLESERLNNLELEWKKNEELRSQELSRKKLEIIKLEKKLKTSLYDIECQEKKIKLEQSRIEERKRDLEQNYKLKTNEIVGSLRRLRNDHKMEIETLNRTINFLKNENELISTKYRNEEKRCNDLRNDLNKNKLKYDNSSIGQLQIENNKLNNKIVELNEKLNEKIMNITNLNETLNQSSIKIKKLQNEIVEIEKKQLDKEKKQMEKLKLELMTKSHFKQLRNDRNELQQIKNTLNKIMNNQS